MRKVLCLNFRRGGCVRPFLDFRMRPWKEQHRDDYSFDVGVKSVIFDEDDDVDDDKADAGDDAQNGQSYRRKSARRSTCIIGLCCN